LFLFYSMLNNNAIQLETNNNEIQKSCSSYKSPVVVEISPLVSYAGEGLEAAVQKIDFQPPVCLISTLEKKVNKTGSNSLKVHEVQPQAQYINY